MNVFVLHTANSSLIHGFPYRPLILLGVFLSRDPHITLSIAGCAPPLKKRALLSGEQSYGTVGRTLALHLAN